MYSIYLLRINISSCIMYEIYYVGHLVMTVNLSYLGFSRASVLFKCDKV